MFTLAESCAMLKYLCNTRKCADHWYPQGKSIEAHQQRARIEEYCDWHHNFLRQGCASYIFKSLFAPIVNGTSFSAGELDTHWKLLHRSLRILED